MNIRRLLGVVLFFVLFSVFSSKVFAQTPPIIVGANLGAYVPPTGVECNISIPSQYTTIQAGIDASNTGDTVCVGAGTYNENVMINKSIRLSGSGTSTSIINGQTGGSTVIIAGDGIANNVILQGFLIRGVDAAAPSASVNLGPFLSGALVRYNWIVAGNGGFAVRADSGQGNDLFQNNILEGTNSFITVSIETAQSPSDKVDFLNNTFTGTVNYTTGDSGRVLSTFATNSLIKQNAFNTSGTITILIASAYPSNIINENNFSSAPIQVGTFSGGTLNAENNWWGDLDPSDNIHGDIDFTPFALSPFPEYSFNRTPVVQPISGTTINEGGTYSTTGSFTDSDSASWTATVDYGNGSGVQPLILSGTNFSLSHQYKDNGSYTVTVSVTDEQNATGRGTATVTVNNVAPTVGTITAPTTPIEVNTSITATANFTDSGVQDTHTALWNWGDGNITPGNVAESNGSGSVSDSHTYTVAGVYTITLTVTDKDGSVGTSTFQYVSVYNPTPQGLFTGNRIFSSPAGAYPQNPNLTGQVQFGVTSKYLGTALIGDVSMNFRAANLEFDATTLTALVISNGQATLRGTGTVNGSGNYNFLVTGLDGPQDAVRFQIKDQLGTVIYDSQLGAVDTATPTASVTGQIIVH